MSGGYVYVLINNSLEGLIKIGSTTLGARERARQLSSVSAIPTPFVVAYEIYVENCLELEKKIHNELSEYRINPNREFFKYPIYKTIELINKCHMEYTSKSNEKETIDIFEAIEIMPQMIKKFGNIFNSSICSMRICQDKERVYFEYTIENYVANYLKNQTISRNDLGFIVDDVDMDMNIEYPTFFPEYGIRFNVQRFIELDEISIANCLNNDVFVEGYKLRV